MRRNRDEKRDCSTAAFAARRARYRWAIPAAALVVFGALTALWVGGKHSAYFGVLRLFGFAPFRFPFLDIQAVLAAAQCQREGIDVYLSNPCDALGRVHVYSPLWLAVIPHFLGVAQTAAVGLALDLAFIVSLFAVLRPQTGGEAVAVGLVVLSPFTIYALERANNDLVVFLLVVAGCLVGRARHPWRLGAYALYLAAGLLKYYPLVLLLLVLREPRRTALAVAAAAAAVVLALAAIGHADLAKALANIPRLSYYADSFSALNLPFGVGEAVAGPRARRAVGLGLLVLLGALAAARARRTAHLFERAPIAWDSREAQAMLAGALLVTACFAAGQNILYRGIWFILVMPGLVRLQRLAGDRAAKVFLAQMIAAVLLVAWEAPLRQAVHAAAGAYAGDWLRLRLELLFWLGREFLWWWLASGLAAVVLAWLLRLPLVVEASAPLRRWPPFAARRRPSAG